jgi:hypothetical protein
MVSSGASEVLQVSTTGLFVGRYPRCPSQKLEYFGDRCKRSVVDRLIPVLKIEAVMGVIFGQQV